MWEIILFSAGFGIALIVGLIAHILVGMRLHLYLVSPDSPIEDQQVIPITASLKKISPLDTLKRGLWKENIEITLVDYHNQGFTYEIGYGLLRRFHLTAKGGRGETSLDTRKLELGKKYSIRTGDTLFVGDRRFEILITPRIDARTEENYSSS